MHTHAQGELIDRIDANADVTLGNIDEAHTQIQKYQRFIKGNRGLMIKTFGVLFFIIIIYGTIRSPLPAPLPSPLPLPSWASVTDRDPQQRIRATGDARAGRLATLAAVARILPLVSFGPSSRWRCSAEKLSQLGLGPLRESPHGTVFGHRSSLITTLCALSMALSETSSGTRPEAAGEADQSPLTRAASTSCSRWPRSEMSRQMTWM